MTTAIKHVPSAHRSAVHYHLHSYTVNQRCSTLQIHTHVHTHAQVHRHEKRTHTHTHTRTHTHTHTHTHKLNTSMLTKQQKKTLCLSFLSKLYFIDWASDISTKHTDPEDPSVWTKTGTGQVSPTLQSIWKPLPGDGSTR